MRAHAKGIIAINVNVVHNLKHPLKITFGPTIKNGPRLFAFFVRYIPFLGFMGSGLLDDELVAKAHVLKHTLSKC